MILILTTNYCTTSEPYIRGFLHTRVKKYIESGLEVEVFVLSSKKKPYQYQYDGVRVVVGQARELLNFINTKHVDTICIHFIASPMMRALNKISERKRVIVFVHGNEALHWYQRIFRGTFSSLKLALGFFKYVVANVIQINTARVFFRKSIHNFEFVAVSKWMKEIAVHNWKCSNSHAWHIIPNVIDSKQFAYKNKHANDAFTLLSLRSFSSGKYANDVTVRLISELKNEDIFQKLRITVIGKGVLFRKTVRPIINIEQVTLINDLLSQDEVKKYHDQNGIFICPTRQDAQGVSMCEAMSSGLIPVTLYNTAIPEYLPSDKRLHCRNVEEMKRLILYLLSNPDEYIKLSKLCSDFIAKKCGEANTIQREIELFNCI